MSENKITVQSITARLKQEPENVRHNKHRVTIKYPYYIFKINYNKGVVKTFDRSVVTKKQKHPLVAAIQITKPTSHSLANVVNTVLTLEQQLH